MPSEKCPKTRLNALGILGFQRLTMQELDSQRPNLTPYRPEVVGWTNLGVLDERGGIAADDGRVGAATVLGQREVPTRCIVVSSNAQIRTAVEV